MIEFNKDQHVIYLLLLSFLIFLKEKTNSHTDHIIFLKYINSFIYI